MGVEILTKRLRSSLTVVCTVAVTAGVLVVGSVIRSNADPVTSDPLPAAAPAAAATAAADGQEAGPRPAPMVVATAAASFGSKLVDGRGATLYVFSLDTPGTSKSKCTGACTGDWPPMRSPGGKPQPGPGASAANIGSIQRPDGSDQVTFNGRPLYYNSGDTGPGQSAGHGRSAYGGQWSAVPPTKP